MQACVRVEHAERGVGHLPCSSLLDRYQGASGIVIRNREQWAGARGLVKEVGVIVGVAQRNGVLAEEVEPLFRLTVDAVVVVLGRLIGADIGSGERLGRPIVDQVLVDLRRLIEVIEVECVNADRGPCRAD